MMHPLNFIEESNLANGLKCENSILKVHLE